MDNLKDVLSHASALVDKGAADPTAAAGMVAQHIQGHFAVSRATLWMLQVQDGERVLSRTGGFDGVTKQTLVEPMLLRESDLGSLFDILVSDSVYGCEDTDADPRFDPLRLARVLPDDIRASLTAPVSINGLVVGIVSCTQINETRRWTQAEMTGLRRVADDIALRYVRRKRLIEQAQLLSGEGPDLTNPPTLT
jgi:GAF domain-containing protein